MNWLLNLMLIVLVLQNTAWCEVECTVCGISLGMTREQVLSSLRDCELRQRRPQSNLEMLEVTKGSDPALDQLYLLLLDGQVVRVEGTSAESKEGKLLADETESLVVKTLGKPEWADIVQQGGRSTKSMTYHSAEGGGFDVVLLGPRNTADDPELWRAGSYRLYKPGYRYVSLP